MSADLHIEIPLEGITLTTHLHAPTVWRSFSFAPEWFADAKVEAGLSGHEHRRREILFAVCAAESYIFEWTRDTALNHDFSNLATYFPPDSKRGVREKFREIPKVLHKDGRIKSPLDCGGQEFAEFHRLVDLRDGLVHASASRPETTGQRPEERPVPSKDELDSLQAGWALAVVQTLFEKLHRDTDTSRPTWL
jgi:hypothetical protein